MKNISYFNIFVANTCIVIMTLICGVSLYLLIAPTVEKYIDGKATITEWSLNLTTLLILFLAIIIVLITVGLPTIIIYWLTTNAFSWIFQFDAKRSTEHCPKSYCIIKSEQSALDRRNFVRTTTGYRKSYTLLLQLTYDELQAVLAEMQSNYSLCYTFPKSFPLPDCVTWYQPRIFLCTIRKLLRQMSPQSSAVLCYRHRLWRDNLDGVKRTKDHILVQANLHQKFCQEADIIIRSTLK